MQAAAEEFAEPVDLEAVVEKSVAAVVEEPIATVEEPIVVDVVAICLCFSDGDILRCCLPSG